MTTPENDIATFLANLSAPDLEQVKALADERLARLREIDDLRARFEEQAATVGLTAEAVINRPAKKKRRGRPPKAQDTVREE